MNTAFSRLLGIVLLMLLASGELYPSRDEIIDKPSTASNSHSLAAPLCSDVLSLSTLSQELLRRIFGFLPSRDQLNLATASSDLRQCFLALPPGSIDIRVKLGDCKENKEIVDAKFLRLFNVSLVSQKVLYLEKLLNNRPDLGGLTLSCGIDLSVLKQEVSQTLHKLIIEPGLHVLKLLPQINLSDFSNLREVELYYCHIFSKGTLSFEKLKRLKLSFSNWDSAISMNESIKELIIYDTVMSVSLVENLVGLKRFVYSEPGLYGARQADWLLHDEDLENKPNLVLLSLENPRFITDSGLEHINPKVLMISNAPKVHGPFLSKYDRLSQLTVESCENFVPDNIQFCSDSLQILNYYAFQQAALKTEDLAPLKKLSVLKIFSLNGEGVSQTGIGDLPSLRTLRIDSSICSSSALANMPIQKLDSLWIIGEKSLKRDGFIQWLRKLKEPFSVYLDSFPSDQAACPGVDSLLKINNLDRIIVRPADNGSYAKFLKTIQDKRPDIQIYFMDKEQYPDSKSAPILKPVLMG